MKKYSSASIEESMKSVNKTAELFLGPKGKKRFRRYLIITIALWFATEIVFEVGFLFVPSEAHRTQVSGMVTQLSGILIGFEAIAVFYFLAAIGSQRDQIIQLQSSLSWSLKEEVEALTENMRSVLLSIDRMFETTSSSLVDSTVFSIGFLAGSVFLAMLSVTIANDLPLDNGIGFLIAGISGVILSITEAQKSQELITQLLSTVAIGVARTRGLVEQSNQLVMSKSIG